MLKKLLHGFKARAKEILPRRRLLSAYDQWAAGDLLGRKPISGLPASAPPEYLATTFPLSSPYGRMVNKAMNEAEILYAKSLLARIKEENIAGDIVEFGVFRGFWLENLGSACRDLGLSRRIYGFDSFEGLPEVDPSHDFDCWAKGDYAASLQEVSERLKEWPEIKLVPGWFQESLFSPDIQAIKEISYARIDCDLYASARDVLAFLTERLTDKSILVFDDWGPFLTKGEAKAFYEWNGGGGALKFEFLLFNSIGHLYLRVHR